jgi:MFS family permease
MGGLAAVVALDSEHLVLLYVVAFALGIGETLFDTAAQSVMPAIVGRDQLSRANGRLYAVELTMNQFVGPPLGGILAGVAIALAFAGSAFCYLVAAFALWSMSGQFRPERVSPPARLRTDIAEGLRYLRNHHLLRTLAFMVGITNLAFTGAFAVFPLYAVGEGSELGLSEAGFGFLLTTMALGSVAGSALAPRIEKALGRANALFLTVVVGAIGVLMPGITSNAGIIALTFAAEGVTIVVWNVITVSLRQRIVPDHLLGRVNAGYRLLAWGTQPLGAALGGLLAEVTSVRTVFVLMAIPAACLVFFRLVVTDAAIDAADVPAHGEVPVAP